MLTTKEKKFLEVLANCGEMGRLICEKDWTNHSLGTPDQWPTVLQVALLNILRSKFPHFIFWGKELFCFYNDAYRPSLGSTGKHPELIGMKGREGWAEISEFIAELSDRIFAGEELPLFDDQLVPIERNGKLEEVYWTYSYSPIFNNEFDISGVLVTCTETTEKILNLKALKSANQRFADMVMQAPVGMCILEGDDLVLTVANDLYLQVAHRTREEAMGKPIFETIKEAKESVAHIFDQIKETGEPFFGYDYPVPIMKHGEVSFSYFDFVYKPILDDKGVINSFLVIVVDVTEKQHVIHALHESEKNYRVLADSMPQFVWKADKEGNLNYWNKETFDYTGFSFQELNEKWIEVVHPDDREINVAAWQAAVTSQKPFLIEHRFKRNDGTYRWQLSRALPHYNEEGELEGWIGTSTDIDEMKRHELQKNDFIKMANHELKTPVTSIKGYVQLLLQTHGNKGDEMLTGTLQTINRQVNKLVALISDLLDISKIETGQLPLDIQPKNFASLIADAVADLRASQTTHQIHLEKELDENLMVPVDSDRIHQVINNLVTNAVKYSPHNKNIYVRVKENKEDVKLEVIDKGIGIDPSHFQFIFDRFYRVSGEVENTYPGFGIGLHIVAEIIQRHKGQVFVDSKVGEGSIFGFTLPKK